MKYFYFSASSGVANIIQNKAAYSKNNAPSLQLGATS